MRRSQEIREAIFQEVESIFSIQIQTFQTIHRGWKNLKWVIETPQGQSFFVKEYCLDRYQGKWNHVERALAIQNRMREKGVCCPKVYVLQDGKRIGSIQKQIFFSVMEVKKGEVMESGTASIHQMASLGNELGKLHQHLQTIRSQEIFWHPKKEDLLNHWKQEFLRSRQKGRSTEIQKALETQKSILDQLDFSLFNSCQPGWTHWDFQMDNLLFLGEEVSAILDFDRMRYAYPELDVARALLSGGLNEEGLAKEKVDAFLHAYQVHRPSFTHNDLGRAFLLIWVIETPWWFRADIEEWEEVPRRFFQEICWIQQNWDKFWKMAVSKGEIVDSDIGD